MGHPDDDLVEDRIAELPRNVRGEQWRSTVARRWAVRLNSTSYIPMSRASVERRLRELVDVIATALAEDQADVESAGHAVGRQLIELHATGESSLSYSLELLRVSLVAEDEPAQPILALLAAIASGYAMADRERTFAQQETLKQALLRSKLEAERELRVSESRFHEVFTSTPVGGAICDLTGAFVEVNPAFEQMLGYSARELSAMTIHDLFHPDDAEHLAAAYTKLAEGTSARSREPRRLVRGDGQEAWTHLAVSVLRDADGAPRHYVTMVDDVTELHLLQKRFQYQALHDAMTGLPNRQFFLTRLETALGTMPKDAELVLYHLSLDGFELINDGLGHEVGDTVVKSVARRLKQLVEGEEGLIARFGGTEFAILRRQGPDAPGIADFAALINEELSEPVYVNDQGIATSASIGIVSRDAGEGTATDLVWAADVALRRAEATGNRQWALFDPEQAPRQRSLARLAAIMPGALEMGDLELRYRPVMTVHDRRVTGVEARLRWQPEGSDALNHADCMSLAERSGVTLSMRDWMVHSAWLRLSEWNTAGRECQLIMTLSWSQARDPDLVTAIRDVLAEPLEPRWLRVCVPVEAVIGESEEIRENIHVLARRGVEVSLHGFRVSPEEVRLLRELPVRTVRLARDVVDLVHSAIGQDVPEMRAISAMLPLIRDCDAMIAVDGVDTESQARCWRELGAEIATGAFYGGELDIADVSKLIDELSGH